MLGAYKLRAEKTCAITVSYQKNVHLISAHDFLPCDRHWEPNRGSQTQRQPALNQNAKAMHRETRTKGNPSDSAQGGGVGQPLWKRRHLNMALKDPDNFIRCM